MPSGAVANVLVTSCRDNICRLWCETLLPDTTSSKGTSKYSKHVENTKEHNTTTTKRPNFSLSIKPRDDIDGQEGSTSQKKRKQVEHAIPLPSQKKEHELHRYYHGKVQRNGLGGNPLHFHIAATINPNTDIPLLPAIGTMTKGSAPNFVVNWLNNKELQFTLAAETLLQMGRESRNNISNITMTTEEEEVDGDTSLDQGTTSDDDDIPTVKIHADTSSPDLTKDGNVGSPRNQLPSRPDSFNTSSFSPPSSTLPNTGALDDQEKHSIDKKFQGLIKEWHCSPDMLYSIHPIDGSFLLWLVDWMDEHIPGVHRQPQVSFSCRIPHAFPTFDATTLCNNLVLYRSNLTMDPRASKRLMDPMSPVDASGLTPSYSFAKYLSQVPSGVDIFAFTPKVSMLSKHTNGSLNQWEISFQEGSKFQTVLNVNHVARSCGHRFSLNHIACHPILPLLVTTSHHNIPKVEVDFDVATSRSRRTSMISRRASIVKRASMVIEAAGQNPVTPGSINLFGKNILSESEHNRLMTLYNSTVEGSAQDFNEKDDIILPDELMEQVNAELNWPDMSAPTGLCSELILWRVFNVGPLGKGGGVMELARINSPFVSAFSHIAWMPSLLPSSCLGPISNSPSACFIASDGYSLRLFQAVIDARTLLNEITPNSNQLEGYLSSSSPVTAFLLQNTEESDDENDDEKKGPKCPQVISLQSTSRPGCIIELDTLNDAKHNWQNVQLMHVYQQQFISGPDSKIRHSRSSHRLGSANSSPLHTSLFEERFFLVVVERKLSGQSMVHMWYIRLERDVSKGGVQCDGLASDEDSQLEDDIPDYSSSDFSDGDASAQYDSEKPTSQVSSKIKTFSWKVCSQKLDLPSGVEVVSATAAAGHLSSSSIYPACVAPYLFTTACSDGKLRFWTCNMSSGDGSESSFDQGEEVPGEIDPSKEDDYTRADYRWEEWKLLVQTETDSSLGVAGLPVALSCAYNGRIACIFRTNQRHENQNADLIPLKLAIYECESTGGSEWMIEEAIDLGMLDLKAWMRREDDEVTESEVINYKTMKRSSKVNDFLDISASPSSSCSSPPSPENLPAVLTQRKRSVLRPKQSQIDDAGLPVQLSWVSKEDGTHILTVGMGSKVVVFAPVSTEFVEAGSTGIPEDIIAQQTGLQRVATMGETTRLRWLPLRTVNLSSVDGIAPHSKMLSWVRAGILVVGLQNEMHVYSQWREENWRSRRRKYRRPVPSTTDTIVSQKSINSSLSVNLQTIPMSRTDREKSYNDMSELLRESTMMSSAQEQEKDNEDIKQDLGLFEISYSTCPVLPQYHPKQLMGLMSSGKIRRVKAILVHLVNCIAGEDAVKQSLLAGVSQDRDQDDEEARFRRSLRTLSVAHSPVEASVLDDSGPKLDYIELVSVPPLPLYRLTSADTPVTVSTAPTATRTMRPTSILGLPDEVTTVDTQDYTQLFSSSLEAFPSSSLDMEGELRSPQDGAASLASKLKDPTYFTVGQAQLLTNYLTHMHLPGLSSIDQMHLLALADTIASTKTEITPHSGGSAGTVIAREGAGYATVDNSDTSHAGETLDECGLRFLLAMRFHVCLTKSLPRHQQVQLKHQGIGSCHFAWAFHSEAEEELLSLVPGLQKGTPTWAELRSVGVGWWVRNNTTLKRCMEKVAKSQFQAQKNPLDAALFYLAMKKKNVLWGLFRSISDQRMTQFFRNDFNTDRWRKAALKNAFALLGRQRFEHAAAFFLLAGSLKDAVEVCMNNLGDVQLAMVVTRLYEDEEMPAKQKEILRYKILAQNEKGEKLAEHQPHSDPFLRSIAFWMLKDYPSSLKTLLQSSSQENNGLKNKHKTRDHKEEEQKAERANPDVFNFYNYLRTHPLLLRRQLADANKGNQGAGLLIVGASAGGFGQTSGGGDQVVKDEITPEERRLFFTTAHAHLSAGCPLLALDVLANIPKVRTKPKEEDNKMVESKSADSIPTSSMISTGTIDAGFSSASYMGSSSKDSGMGMDWGAPVSSQLTNGHKSDSGLEMDWGAPLGGRLEEEELNLDWDDDDKEDEIEVSKTLEQKKSSSSEDTVNSTLVNGADDSASSGKNNSTLASDDEQSGIDIMAQQLKFICCLKIMMEELRTLATGFEVDGGQLRYQLYIWLEQQVETLQQLCNYGSPTTTKNVVEDDDFDEQDGMDTDGGQGTLYEQLQAKRLDLEEKRQRAVRRKRWLRDNHHLLRTLVSYTMQYGAAGGGLASVAMELVLLVQELQQERVVQQLSSPLPIPTTLPLMSASIANCKTVVTDPILYLRLHIHSVLRTILDFSAPPSPNHHAPIIAVVHALSAALSACIYQSLCDSDSFSASVGKSKVTGMDAYTPGGRSHVMYRVGHLVGVGRKRSRHQSQEQNNLSITSPPGKWPGVATYQALLASERDTDVPSPNIQLCEGLIAVYMSLLLHALSNNNANELFRLVAHDLNGKTWASVFGGGAKVVAQNKLLASHSSSSGDEVLAKQRVTLALRLMGKARTGGKSAAATDDKPALREVFVPPETSLRDYFLVKPYIPPGQSGTDYDSNASDSSDEEDLDQYMDDDDYDDIGPFSSHSSQRKRNIPLPGETEHSDANSYSWCLMRYAVVKLVISKVQSFLPIAGIEIAELPVASAILHSILKLLEQWQQACVRKLDLFARPPPDFISETGGSSMTGLSGPAILRYKGLLDPNNTPFRSDSKATLPAKRLWNFLVRQEVIQDLFIQYIFKKGSVMEDMTDSIRSPSRSTSSLPQAAQGPFQARLVHKEQEKISAFCFNQADWKNISMNGEFQSNPSSVVVSTHRGLLELDISLILTPDNSFVLDDDDGGDQQTKGRNSQMEDEFLMVQPASIPSPRMNKSSSVPFIQLPPGGFNPAFPSDSTPAQTGRSTHVITHRPLYHIRKLSAHPNLPYYLSGSNDGSVHMWEWGHSQKLYTHRAPGQFPKVTQINFNDQGNKFGVCDDGGQLALWQVGMNSPAATRPFWSMACHNKTAYDFTFLGSSSLLVTSGLSTDSKNVCLWDTLLPFRKCMVHGFSCHEGGVPSVLYCPRQQTIIAGSKKGEVSIFDIRQRKLRHTFQAHESSIRTLCVDPMEEFFVTGSAEGNIKVWSLSVHSLLHYFPGQHTRGNFFRQSGNGVVQLALLPPNNLYSCGADGTMKWRNLNITDNPSASRRTSSMI